MLLAGQTSLPGNLTFTFLLAYSSWPSLLALLSYLALMGVALMGMALMGMALMGLAFMGVTFVSVYNQQQFQIKSGL